MLAARRKKLLPDRDNRVAFIQKKCAQTQSYQNSILASFNAIKSSQLDLKTESFSSSVQFGVEQDTSGGIDTISMLLFVFVAASTPIIAQDNDTKPQTLFTNVHVFDGKRCP
jgi:hypothetical protein